MQKSSANTLGTSQFWRMIPAMLGALLVVLLAVDALLAYEPAILKDLSSSWRSLVTMQPVLAPSANAMAATLAIASVVLASAVLLVFARATAGAAHLSLTPSWVAFCMLVVAAIRTPLPLPVSTPWFAALCALLFVGAGMLLRLGSWAGTISGWCSIALPFVLVTDSYVRAPSTGTTFGRDAGELLLWLGLSALGVVLIAYARPRGQSAGDEVEGLEGVDVVQTLFEQVERAERSEARVAELERQLNDAYARRRAS
jgi:hypothetical protein